VTKQHDVYERRQLPVETHARQTQGDRYAVEEGDADCHRYK
jgi:hypothetical protein